MTRFKLFLLVFGFWLIGNIMAIAQPKISSISPAAGNVGSTVSINGTGFNATPANNTVYFGSVKASVLTASSTVLTVSVPKGATYDYVSVTTANLTAYSQQKFDVTFPCGGVINSRTLSSQSDFPAESNPGLLAIGDLNLDGLPDIAMVSNSSSNQLATYKNTTINNSIAFDPKSSLNTTAAPSGIALGDLNGDGLLDIVIAKADNTISIYMNTSTIGGNLIFVKTASDYTTGTNPQGIVVGDLNADGKPEIAVANYGSSNISIFKNTSSASVISFSTTATLLTSLANPVRLAIGDMDADSYPDIVVTNDYNVSDKANVSIFKNSSTISTISFPTSSRVDFTTSKPNAKAIAIGDLNGDGRLDFAITHMGAYNINRGISIYINASSSGGLSYSLQSVNNVTYAIPEIAFSDVDGDGRSDIAIEALDTGSGVLVYKNTSTMGVFSINPAVYIPFSTIRGGMAWGDLDNNGTPELAGSSYGSLSILKNIDCNVCQKVTKSQDPSIQLVTPVNFSSIDENATLQFNINSVPLLGGPSQYDYYVEIAPEAIDQITGVRSPDWTKSFQGPHHQSANVSPGTFYEQLKSVLSANALQSNLSNNYYWRVRLISTFYAPYTISPIYKFTLKPYSPPIPAQSYLTDNNLHSNKINWVYGVSYLDDGQTSEGIAYIDGLGKSRQVQSKQNSDNSIMAVEAVYSEEGGGTVMSLPAPINNNGVTDKFKYAHRFFDVLENGKYVDFATEHFDREIKGTTNTLMPPVAVDESVAGSVGNYYSANNPDAYIDAAGGFPYAYNVPEKSPLQRAVMTAAGVGADFKMTSGHENKFSYGKPSQEELIRIYGTKAPDASKISQTISTDPDGVGHVSYTDNEGKLIATAVKTCDSDAPSLMPLAEDGEDSFISHVNPLLTDRMDPVSLQRTANSKFSLNGCGTIVTHLTYTVSLSSFKVSETSSCEDCKYEVEVKIINDQTGAVAFTKTQTVSPPSTTCTNGPQGITLIDQDISLTKGNYTITRVIKPAMNTTTGENVFTTALNNYTSTLVESNQQLLNDFTTKYNTQNAYFLLRLVKPTRLVASPVNALCNVTVNSFAYAGGTTNDYECTDLSKLTLSNPSGITKDNKGNFYIAQAGNHTIQLIEANGYSTIKAGTRGLAGSANGAQSTASFNAPTDIVFRPYIGIGNDQVPACLIVADKNNNAIRMINIATGAVTTISTALNPVSLPEGLGIDASGNVYVASTGNGIIYKISFSSGSASFTRLYSTYVFSSPTDIAIADDGTTFITNRGTNQLLEFAPAATIPTAITATNFTAPTSVVYVNPQLVYVSTTGSNKLFSVNPQTNVATLLAGTTTGSTDGAASVAQFNSPKGLYSDGIGELYVADFTNNKIRNVEVRPCDNVTTAAAAYDWYADRTIVTNITNQSPYTVLLSQLDADKDGVNGRGDEQYRLTSMTAPIAATATLKQNFVSGFFNVTGVDLTNKITAINVYTIGSGSETGSTSLLPVMNEFGILDAADKRSYYLLNVVYTDETCEEACQDVTPTVNCSTYCDEQQLASKIEMDDAYTDLTKGTGTYGTSNVNLQTLVNSFYPLAEVWYSQLNDNDIALYDSYADKRMAYETFSLKGCVDMCNNVNPGPCVTCVPEYEMCVYDNVTTLNNGFDYFMDKWAANNNAFPYTSANQLKTNEAGVLFPVATESEKLSLPFLNYLYDNFSSLSTKPYSFWDAKGGSCSNCVNPSTTSPVCAQGTPRDMSRFPSVLIPLLQTMNASCATQYNNCLQLNGTAAQEQTFLCNDKRDRALEALGPEPQPNNSTNPAWVDYQSNLSAVNTDYSNCFSMAANDNGPLAIRRKDRITETLVKLYPYPDQSQAVITLRDAIYNDTKALTILKLEEYLAKYENTQSCVLDCKQKFTNEYKRYILEQREKAENTVREKFINGCYGSIKESLDLSYSSSVYHYTLYNYDKANNLISTIPPEGVDYINLNDPAQYNPSTKTALRDPQHRMASTYKSNTLYTLESTSPDEGATKYLYDKAGRLRFSQNAEQYAREQQLGYKIFSYVKYDNEGRVVESGEFQDNYSWGHIFCSWSAAYPQTCSYAYWTSVEGVLDYQDFPAQSDDNTFEETFVSYDNASLPNNTLPDGSGGYRKQTYLQGRVAKTYNTAENNALVSTSHYSYDAHGRVSFVVQEIPALSAAPSPSSAPGTSTYKTVDYVYKNLSSRVDQIIYQKGNTQEEFRQKYTYDSDYRITKTEVSRDGGNTWLPASDYEYYKHGPLKRTGLGNKIQDMDYVYNINGWLKAINNPLATNYANDANESTTAGNAAPDVFGEAINYYRGDYKRTGVGLDASTLTVPTVGSKLYNNAKNLYSGNISSTVSYLAFDKTGLTPVTSNNILAQGYTYDVLNRLTNVYAETKAENFTSYLASTSTNTDYSTSITYDANGNILTLVRNSLTRAIPGVTGNSNQMDNMTYRYAQTTKDYKNVDKKINNRLAHVNDAAISEAALDDIKDQGTTYAAATVSTHNYQYDAKGRITRDLKSNISKIEWTVSDKVKKITKTDGTIITFAYNAQQQRLSKTVDPTGANNDITTFYTYDANGMLMANYSKTYSTTAAAYQYLIDEHQMYGMGRLGVYNVNEVLVTSPSAATNDAGKQFFELSDHLGSVRAVVTGTKQSNGNATIASLTDYHEFGMTMQGRSFVSSSINYRFGYQGSEKDKEINSGAYTTDFRGLDVRIGRWLSPDPITHVSQSPYVSMDNNPIALNDVMGLETGDGCGGEAPTTTPNPYEGGGSGTPGTPPNPGGGGAGAPIGSANVPSLSGGAGGMTGLNSAFNNFNNIAGGAKVESIVVSTKQTTNGDVTTVVTEVSVTGGGMTVTTTTRIEYSNSINSSVDLNVNTGIDQVGNKIVSQYSPPPTKISERVDVTFAPINKFLIELDPMNPNTQATIEFNRKLALNTSHYPQGGRADLDNSPFVILFAGVVSALCVETAIIVAEAVEVAYLRSAIALTKFAERAYFYASVAKIHVGRFLKPRFKIIGKYLEKRDLGGVGKDLKAAWPFIKAIIRQYSDDIIYWIQRIL